MDKLIIKMETKIVLNFIDSINCADIDKMVDLMAADHIFIDSQENKIVGKDNMRQAWTGYFSLFPDYKIEVNEIFRNNSLICVFGHAGGTYKNLVNDENTNYWKIPIALKAIVKENQIASWQVYADNSPVIDILNKNR